MVFVGLNQRFFDIFRAEIKIYGFLQTAAAQNRINVRLQLDFQMILKDQDPVDEQLQIVPLQLVLFLNVAEDVNGGLGRAVQLPDIFSFYSCRRCLSDPHAIPGLSFQPWSARF